MTPPLSSLVFKLLNWSDDKDQSEFEKSIKTLQENHLLTAHLTTRLLEKASFTGRRWQVESILNASPSPDVLLGVVYFDNAFVAALRGGSEEVVKYLWSFPNVQEYAHRHPSHLMDVALQSGHSSSFRLVWENVLHPHLQNQPPKEKTDFLLRHMYNWLAEALPGSPAQASVLMSHLPLDDLSSFGLYPEWLEKVFLDQSPSWQNAVAQHFSVEAEHSPASLPNIYAHLVRQSLWEAVALEPHPEASPLKRKI